MASNIILNLINKWFGGITSNTRDTIPGVHANMEEVDIFSSKNYVRPNTIFAADSDNTIETGGYAMSSNDILYAVSNNTQIKVWKKTSASTTSPSSWSQHKASSYFYPSNGTPVSAHQHYPTWSVSSITRSGTTATVTTSASHGLASNDSVTISGADQGSYNGQYTITVTGADTFTYTVGGSPATPATGTIDASMEYLYYVAGAASGSQANSLVRLGAIQNGATESLTDIAGTTMTLPGAGASTDRVAMFRINGELHILNGQYISTVDETGVFIAKNFTLPNEWQAISMDAIGGYGVILARNVNNALGYCKIFFWDFTATSGPADEIKIPFGGPQIVVNLDETIFAFCAQSNMLKVYGIIGKTPKLAAKLDNVATGTDERVIIPDSSKFIQNGVLNFGLYKTDKSGLYQFGKLDTAVGLLTSNDSGYAILLGRRFHTSSYALHIPNAAIAAGSNVYANFMDNGTAASCKVEGSTPTFSSNAVIETVYIDGGSPDILKDWIGFAATTPPIPASCSIVISARVDDATSYDANSAKTLSSSNDQIHTGGTADTYWRRDWTSVSGRAVQVKIAFTSNGSTARPTLYNVGVLSRQQTIYG